MLQAVADDIARIPGYSIVTTLEAGTESRLEGEVIVVDDAEQEAAVFQRLLGEVEAVLVIAPETNGVLKERCRRVIEAGVASWNCSPAAIGLCGDKLRLAEHLLVNRLPTIPARIADFSTPANEMSWPVVLKPRDGAGSCFTFLIQNVLDWEAAIETIREAGVGNQFLVQPYATGRSLSIGMNISLDGKRIECLPVGEQRLSGDGRFQYLGGRIPANLPSSVSDAIQGVARATCRTIPGLAGYVGIDFVLTDQGDPLIVEINPRLTTSYVGYRQLYDEALPQRWLPSTGAITNSTARSIEFGPFSFLNSW